MTPLNDRIRYGAEPALQWCEACSLPVSWFDRDCSLRHLPGTALGRLFIVDALDGPLPPADGGGLLEVPTSVAVMTAEDFHSEIAGWLANVAIELGVLTVLILANNDNRAAWERVVPEHVALKRKKYAGR